LASQLRRFGGHADAAGAAGSIAIAFPPDKAELDAPPADAPEIVLKAEGGALPLTWVVDGVPLETAADERAAVWRPNGAGFSRISVIDATGRADQVKIRIR
jgi:penicillin-binding protein 1C